MKARVVWGGLGSALLLALLIVAPFFVLAVWATSFVGGLIFLFIALPLGCVLFVLSAGWWMRWLGLQHYVLVPVFTIMAYVGWYSYLTYIYPYVFRLCPCGFLKWYIGLGALIIGFGLLVAGEVAGRWTRSRLVVLLILVVSGAAVFGLTWLAAAIQKGGL